MTSRFDVSIVKFIVILSFFVQKYTSKTEIEIFGSFTFLFEQNL